MGEATSDEGCVNVVQGGGTVNGAVGFRLLGFWVAGFLGDDFSPVTQKPSSPATHISGTLVAARRHPVKSAALLAIAVAFLLGIAPPRAAAQDGPVVLCYHIVESPHDPRMEISREAVRQQMRYLAMTGYNVIPLREAYEYAIGKRQSIPPRSVVVTI